MVLTPMSFFLDFTSWVPDFPGSPTLNSGLHYFYPFCSFLTHQLWSPVKRGIFHSLLNPESSHSGSCIHCPRSLSLRTLTFPGSQENSRGAELSACDPHPKHGVKYPCHFLGKHPEDPGYIFDNMDCKFRIGSLLLGFTQKENKRPYKEIFCLFYIPEDPLAGFSTLLSLYCFFRFHKKIMAVTKTATVCRQLALYQAQC